MFRLIFVYWVLLDGEKVAFYWNWEFHIISVMVVPISLKSCTQSHNSIQDLRTGVYLIKKCLFCGQADQKQLDVVISLFFFRDLPLSGPSYDKLATLRTICQLHRWWQTWTNHSTSPAVHGERMLRALPRPQSNSPWLWNKRQKRAISEKLKPQTSRRNGWINRFHFSRFRSQWPRFLQRRLWLYSSYRVRRRGFYSIPRRFHESNYNVPSDDQLPSCVHSSHGYSLHCGRINMVLGK